MVLADNGADVVKVEAPDGDPTRRQSAAAMWHRGKRSVVADLRREEGRSYVQRLAQKADVLLHNYRPGRAERLGVGYEDLAAGNPALVYCAISGFGPRGPYAQYRAYEGIVNAKAGVMQGYGTLPGRPGPAYAANPLAGFGASQMALHGILAALRVRDQTGRGQRVETSLWQGRVSYDMVQW